MSRSWLLVLTVFVVHLPAQAVEAPVPPPSPSTADGFEAYERVIPGTPVKFRMVPIPGGSFLMGSPADEPKRRPDEGPQRKVTVSPFWMGACEVTWDEYDLWSASLEKLRRSGEPSPADLQADGVTRPTPPYTDMTFGMGKEGYPAICMTQLAAKTYCEWLSAKTGEYYRLPTEAEWEYACRAGTTSAYSFGDDPASLKDHGWFKTNARTGYRPVGQKPANPWGLFDMHGNVAEWCLDQHGESGYPDGPLVDPFVSPTTLYPRVVRGGGWRQSAADCRSGARMGSGEHWKMRDPQLPQSVWYHTDAAFVGFRIVRPRAEPSAELKKMYQ